ncbi:MAG: ABC transporter substrate-binding protein [Brevinema sp.]
MKILVYFFIFSVVGCASIEKKNLITIAIPTEIPSLTPYAQNDTTSYRIRWQIFERLIAMDTNGDLLPSLAVSWTNISPTVFQVKLRQGVTFHNGAPFTAEDVKYSVERAASAPTLNAVLSIIKGAEIVDEETVNILLNAPYAAIDVIMTHSGLVMTHAETQKTVGSSDIYIGTGPYKFVEWKRGDSISLVRNDNYWADLPNIENLLFRVVPDDSVRALVVETGEIDIAYDIAGGDRERFLNSSQVQFIEAPTARQEYLGFNVGRAPNTLWTNKLIRQALAYAIDYQGIVDSVMFGGAVPASSMLAPMVFGVNTNLPVRTRNLEKAKELLAQVGISPGTRGKIYAIEGPRKKIAEVIQANAQELGIILEIVIFEWAKFLESAGRGELELFLAGWVNIPSDPDVGMYALVYSRNKGPGGNYTFYGNPEIDALLDIGRREQNIEQRLVAYYKAQEIIYDDMPLLPLFYSFNNVALSKDIKGFVLNQFSIHELKFVSR